MENPFADLTLKTPGIKYEDPAVKEPESEESKLKREMTATASKLEEIRAGRNLGDIPRDDEYWVVRNEHSEAFTKWKEYCKHNIGVENAR